VEAGFLDGADSPCLSLLSHLLSIFICRVTTNTENGEWSMENGEENEQMGLRTGNYNKVAREAFDASQSLPLNAFGPAL